MKFLFTLYSLLLATCCMANMASPVVKAPDNNDALTTKDIDILKEHIDIYLAQDKPVALFDVTYTIRNTVGKKQVPLLFIARQYREGFRVWLDGRPVTVLQLPDSLYRGSTGATGTTHAVVNPGWSGKPGDTYPPGELHYFEPRPDTGIHTIRVRYTAIPALDRGPWISKVSFTYLLKPAFYWKSFGPLDIVMHTAGFPWQVSSDIQQLPQVTGTLTCWRFEKGKPESFTVSYTPQLTGTARKLANTGPFTFAVITGILLALLHLWLMLWYRSGSKARYNPVMITGSLIVPFLFCQSYLWYYDIVDNLIGVWASRYHGYIFLIFVLYPLIMPVYWLVYWLTDRIARKHRYGQ